MSLVLADQGRYRSVYESRYTVLMVFHLLQKTHKKVYDAFDPVFLLHEVMPWLVPVLPLMPVLEQIIPLNHRGRVFVQGDRLYWAGPETITVLDANTYAEITTMTEHNRNVNSITEHDGKVFAGDESGRVHVWKTSDSSYISTTPIIVPEAGPVQALVADKGRLFVAAYGSNFIHVFNTITHAPITTLTGHANGLRCLSFQDGNLLSGSLGGTIKVWDCDSYELLYTFVGHLGGDIMCLAFYNDHLISGNINGNIFIWNRDDQSLIAILATRTETRGVVISIAVHNDILCAKCHPYGGSSDGTSIFMWDLRDHKYLGKLKHPEMIDSLAVHDGKLLYGRTGVGIQVMECEAMPLSAKVADPEASQLSIEELVARITDRKEVPGEIKLILPGGGGRYKMHRDIEKLKNTALHGMLVRLYNRYVRATRDLTDAERDAPFCHNITFPSAKSKDLYSCTYTQKQ